MDQIESGNTFELHDAIRLSVYVLTYIELIDMHPRMWAYTKEAYAMQLVMLADIYIECGGEGIKKKGRELLPIIFECSAVTFDILMEEVTEEWAHEAVARTKKFLNMKEQLS